MRPLCDHSHAALSLHFANYSKHNGEVASTLVADLGDYLREQRVAARLSLRQLSDLAGISNPYLSQIERGLKRPSAEILQQIAHGLQVSAESLYVRAGFLEEGPARPGTPRVLDAIAADPMLTPKQRAALVEVYRAFVGRSADEADHRTASEPVADQPTRPRTRHTSGKPPAVPAAAHSSD